MIDFFGIYGTEFEALDTHSRDGLRNGFESKHGVGVLVFGFELGNGLNVNTQRKLSSNTCLSIIAE